MSIYNKTGDYQDKEIIITDELKAEDGFTWQIGGEPKIQIEVVMEINGKKYSRFFLMPCEMKPEEIETYLLSLPQFENSTVI